MEHHIKQRDHTGLLATLCSLTSNYWTDAVPVRYSTFWLLVAQYIKGRQQSTDRKQWPRRAEETYHQRRTYKQQTQQDSDALAEAVKVARTCNTFITFTAHWSRSSRCLAVFMTMLCDVRPWAMVGCSTSTAIRTTTRSRTAITVPYVWYYVHRRWSYVWREVYSTYALRM